MSTWSDADGRLGKMAEYYTNLGWMVFPCQGIIGGKCTCGKVHPAPKDVGKHPATVNGFKDGTTDVTQVAEWWSDQPERNIGVWCSASGFIVVDVDPRNGGTESWDKLEELTAGAMEDTVEALTGEYVVGRGVARGRHLFYRVKDGENLKGKIDGVPGIDIKHKGYVLIAPSRHGSGLIYEWREGHEPWKMQMAWAPDELLALIRKGGAPGVGGGTGSEFGVMEWAGEKMDVDALIRDGIPDGERAVTLFRIACAVANELPTRVLETERGKQQVRFTVKTVNDKACHPPMEWGTGGGDDFAHQCDNAIRYVLENPKDRALLTEEFREWRAATLEMVEGKPTPAPVTRATKITALPVAVRGGAAGGISLPPDPDDPTRALLAVEEKFGILRRTLTDVGNGRRLADFYSQSTKYTVGLGWYCWDGMYWAPDPGMQQVRERAKNISTVIQREALSYDQVAEEEKVRDMAKFAMQCKSNSMIHNAVTSAQSDPRVDVPLERWDGDDYQLGVINGVVNLRTGDLISGDPGQYITKRCAVAYTPGLRNIRFEQFLDWATDGDAEYKEWLQKAAGLTISGRREQDLLFLVYGLPGTGKNTLVEAIFLLLANYSQSLNPDLLLARRQASSQDMYDYAEMIGKRMLWVDELPEAERMKDDKVKKLTGSENIDGRSPGERPISFKSKAKLWISTNHRPPIRDDAMWRRLRPIPFNRVPERSDPSLKPYIHDPEGALPAVLSWAVEGAIKYFGSAELDGLGWCTKVWDAADMYRREEDTIRIFLDEETRVVAGGELSMKPLYQVYRMWCEDRGERPMSIRPFCQKLLERGEKVSGMGQRAVVGDRAFVPRAVESAGSWDSLVGNARM